MRYLMKSTASTTSAVVIVPADSSSASAPAQAIQQSAVWHSPVPYLFGGLSAMLGLIAFALLILACSYWKLARQINDLENGEDEKKNVVGRQQVVYEEQFVVILAGHDKPSCLATPATNNKTKMNSTGSDLDEEKTAVHDADEHQQQSDEQSVH